MNKEPEQNQEVETEVVKLSELMRQAPEMETSGELSINNYENLINSLELLHDEWDKRSIPQPKTSQEYWDLQDLSQGIKAFQAHIKASLTKLDNLKITNVRQKSNRLLTLLGKKAGTTPGNVKYYLEEYKANEKIKIIEACFVNVKHTQYFIGTLNMFSQYCDVAFQGQSKFPTMQLIAETEAESYSKELKGNNALYKEYLGALNDLCAELEYKPDIELLDREIRETILNDAYYATVQNKLRNKAAIEKAELLQQQAIAKKQQEILAAAQCPPVLKPFEPSAQATTQTEERIHIHTIQFVTTQKKYLALNAFLALNDISHTVIEEG